MESKQDAISALAAASSSSAASYFGFVYFFFFFRRRRRRLASVKWTACHEFGLVSTLKDDESRLYNIVAVIRAMVVGLYPIYCQSATCSLSLSLFLWVIWEAAGMAGQTHHHSFSMFFSLRAADDSDG